MSLIDECFAPPPVAPKREVQTYKSTTGPIETRSCSECKRPSFVLFEQEPGTGPRGDEPRHLCPKCVKE